MYNVLTMIRATQLAAVVIALVLVLSAGGYGIVRGILADGQRPATTWRSATTCRTGTAQEIPVVNSLTLPTRLPEGVCLTDAYYSTVSLTTLLYSNEQRDKVLLVAFLEGGTNPAPTGAPIQLGNLVGYVEDTTRQDGTRVYDISFEKSGWGYHVTARLDQDNKVTPDELNAVALSMAEG